MVTVYTPNVITSIHIHKVEGLLNEFSKCVFLCYIWYRIVYSVGHYDIEDIQILSAETLSIKGVFFGGNL